MVATAYGKVINCVRASTRYGPRLALNIKLNDGEKVACWSDVLDNQSFLSLKTGDEVRLIKGARGTYSLIQEESSNETRVQMNRLSNNGSEESYYTYNSNEVIEESNLELPMLSDAQKKELAMYIKQQANMFKHITDTVSSTMPDLKPQDHRAIAMSIFIDAQRKIERHYT